MASLIPATKDFIHVVAAIIWHPTRADTFLIATRPKGKHLQDYWEFPGGKREPGETRLAALQRELLEEIDIVCKLAQPFLQVNHQYPDRKILLDVWQVIDFEGEITALEGQQVMWVQINNMYDYRFPEADLPVLAAIANSVKA